METMVVEELYANAVVRPLCFLCKCETFSHLVFVFAVEINESALLLFVFISDKYSMLLQNKSNLIYLFRILTLYITKAL